jgi:hypothetical protein
MIFENSLHIISINSMDKGLSPNMNMMSEIAK